MKYSDLIKRPTRNGGGTEGDARAELINPADDITELVKKLKLDREKDRKTRK